MIFLLLLLFPALVHAADGPIRGFPSKEAAQQKQWEEKGRAIPQPSKIEEYIRTISKEPHHAGSPGSKAVAEELLALLKSWGFDAAIEEFEGLLPTPTTRKLELIEPVRFEAKLQEPAVGQDPDSTDQGQLPTYNAYSAAGDITAPVVYVNYGIPEDYAYLKKQGIDVKGKIVLARYGASWRGVKPKVAYENGAIACLIYSDPKEDGYFAGDSYPAGPFRPREGVQRGSVMEIAIHPGDPLSPGWASEKGSRRLSLDEAKTLQKILVLPISYAEALPLLQSLAGPVAPEAWRGALPLTYHIGPGPARVHLQLEFDWSTRPIYNVIARIPGSDFPDQWVMYGNHHDAWVNGAADPASGAAALLETARSLAELRKQGWRPKRTVVLALWDAEEFGLVGSVEWAEKHAAELDKKLVVYLNSDMNGRGPLNAAGSHTLEAFLAEVLRDVPAPGGTKSLLEAAQATGKQPKTAFQIGPLGSGSDYAAFIHHLGVSSLNMGFSEDESRGIYHSIYDSFYWYSHFSDTGYAHGVGLSRVMLTSLLRLADAPLLPFQFVNFAKTAEGYLADLSELGAGVLRLDDVRKELGRISKAAAAYESRYNRSLAKAPAVPAAQLAAANELLFRTERSMLSPAGLPGREWFKHQIYAPGLYTGYGAKTLPGVREFAEAGRWDEANQQVEALVLALRAVHSQIQQAEKALARF